MDILSIDTVNPDDYLSESELEERALVMWEEYEADKAEADADANADEDFDSAWDAYAERTFDPDYNGF